MGRKRLRKNQENHNADVKDFEIMNSSNTYPLNSSNTYPFPICFDLPYDTQPSSLTPFPLIGTELVPKFNGRFTGFNIIVEDANEISILYSMGCFGKGSLSRGRPCFKTQFPIISQCQWERRRSWFAVAKDERSAAHNEKILVVINDNEDCEQITTSTNDVNKRSNEDLLDTFKPRIVHEEFVPVIEELHLTLEEAFFLAYCFDCLKIHYNDTILKIPNVWTLFQQTSEDFIDRYIAYHYFRAKGWVVKPGTKYGGDFLLYKKGPEYYHSSYVVIIDVISDAPTIKMHKLDKNSLVALNRAIEATNKIMLICQVWKPLSFDKTEVNQLSQCCVSELRIERWVASQNRLNVSLN